MNTRDPMYDEADDTPESLALVEVNAAIARIKACVAKEMEGLKDAIALVPELDQPSNGWIEETVDEVFYEMRQYLSRGT